MKTTQERSHKQNLIIHGRPHKPKRDHRPTKPKEEDYEKRTRNAIEFEREHNIPTYLESDES
jgi:hypothetical protein